MNSDEALENLRKLTEEALGEREGSDKGAVELLTEISGRFNALDDWIRGGGFLPTVWSKF